MAITYRGTTAYQRHRRAAGTAREQQRLSPDSAIPAQRASPETAGLTDAGFSPTGRRSHTPTRGDRKATPLEYGPYEQAAGTEKVPTPNNRNAPSQLLLALAVLVASTAGSIPADPLQVRHLEKTGGWTRRERLRFLWYRLRLAVQEMNYASRRMVELQMRLPGPPLDQHPDRPR